MTLKQRFGELMRQHRDIRPAEAVARKVGCSGPSIANMEKGEGWPRLPVYIRLCRFYGLTPAQRAELDEIAAGAAEEVSS